MVWLLVTWGSLTELSLRRTVICAIFTPFLLKNLQHHMISIINCPVRPLLQEWDVWKSVAKPGQGKQKNNCKFSDDHASQLQLVYDNSQGPL